MSATSLSFQGAFSGGTFGDLAKGGLAFLHQEDYVGQAFFFLAHRLILLFQGFIALLFQGFLLVIGIALSTKDIEPWRARAASSSFECSLATLATFSLMLKWFPFALFQGLQRFQVALVFIVLALFQGCCLPDLGKARGLPSWPFHTWFHRLKHNKAN